MILKYLFLILLITGLYAFGMMHSDNGTSDTTETCDQVASIIKKVVSAKVEYEKAICLKTKKIYALRSRYSTLVKMLKEKDKIGGRKECLRQMILKDSLAPVNTFVEFTYRPSFSSSSDVCDWLANSAFLKTMLKNLDDSDNDSVLVCDPAIAVQRK